MRFKKLLSLLMSTVMVITLLPSSAFADVNPDPDLTKMAEWVPGENGLAKITLTTKGTPLNITTGADVVMVLDASGSMGFDLNAEEWVGGRWKSGVLGNHFDGYYAMVALYTANGHESEPFEVETNRWGDMTDYGEIIYYNMLHGTMYEAENCGTTRWDVASDAVAALTEEVIPNSTSKNRLGLVVFSSSGYDSNTKKCDFTNDSDDILDVIPDTPGGGTDYTLALQSAQNMLNARTDKTRPGYVVFLTDGAPGLSGKSGDDINWNGANQIAALKAADISIYTVGFNLSETDATNRLENYATTSGHYQNISDAAELTGLLSDIGSTISSAVTIQDSIDTRYFTIAKNPDGSNKFVHTNGSVLCTNDKDITWSLDNFSPGGDSLEIYIQLKSQYINENGDYPTNEVGSAYGKYVGSDGNKVDLPVSTTGGSSPVPTLNAKAKSVKVKFEFIGTYQNKASFNDPSQADQSIEIGKKVTKPDITVADGYKITDWYVSGACSGAAFDFNKAISENSSITLFARVDKDATAKYAYTVEFYKNGVKSETVPGSVWAGEPSITVADAKTMKTGNYTNYSFTEAKVGATTYSQNTDKIAIGKNGNTVIEVYYTAGAVDLTFERGEFGKFSAVADTDKEFVTIPSHYDATFNDAPGIKAELGWKTVGWYEKEDTQQKIVTFPQTITAAKTFVMKYEKNDADWKSVTFLKNDGTTAQHKVVDNILVGSSVPPEAWPAKPDRNGYEFKGWFTKDGTNGDWGNQFIQTTVINENTSVYAKWEKTTTDVAVDYYLGSVGGKKLTFSQPQNISDARIGASYTEYINDALKGKGTVATNQDSEKVYYEISNEKAIVYINGELLGAQSVKDGDSIQIVYPAKMGKFRVWEYFLENDTANNHGQYLNDYEASLSHGSDLKYGADKTDLNITEINKILSDSLESTRKTYPGAKLNSVYIDYQELNANGVATWQTPITATLNAAGTAVETFNGLDQMIIHGACETRLTFSYELPVEVRVEYHKQYGDTNNYYKIDGKDYVIGGGTSYVYKNDMLDIVENATLNNNLDIEKVVPAGVAGYQVARVATKDTPTTAITTDRYQITKPTTFIVFLDAITANSGKIVNVDNTGAALEGGKFVFNQTNLTADSAHKNEYPITQNFVYGVEYTVKQTESSPGYDKVNDFNVKLKADGSGLELDGTVQNVTVDGMTITVANSIDVNQKFEYTVNRYIKGTTTPVPGFTLDELKGMAPLGNFTWTNVTETTTGYKLVTNPAQPTGMRITTDATKNTANVYYEVDDSQTRGYKITYWKDGESQPFSMIDNLTVLEANPMVAYTSITMDNIPTGYELKGVVFGGNDFNPDENVVITSSQNEIKVIYQKQAGMWFDVTFLAGNHGKLNTDQDKVEWLQVLKDTTVTELGGIPTVNPENGYEFIGWSTDGGATLIQTADLPNTISQSATYTAQWTKIYNLQYFVYEKENNSDTTITAKFETEADAAAAVAAHITHNSAQYSAGFFANESKISNVNFAKFNVSTTPDTKDRTETADAKFADLIRNYKDTLDLNAEYARAPGYNIVPFRLVLEGDLVHVDCYLVKNAEEWTTITFKPGDHGKWADDTTNDVVVDAIKGADWSAYANQVPTKPVQNEIGWKLADEIQIWDQALPSETTSIPDTGLVYTAAWVVDNATLSFEIVGEKHGAENPVDVTIQKGKTTTPPTVSVDKGYVLDGWYTDAQYSNKFDFSNPITGNTKLYAKVDKNAEEWTTITFKPGDHGKWADSTTNDVVVDAIKGADWSAYANQVPAKPVQNEIGWKLADEIQIWDQALPTVVPDGAVVYTAVWVVDNATLSFEIVGEKHGAENPVDVTIQKGKTTTPPTISVDKGYVLDGWYTDAQYSNKFDFSNPITGNTKLYAKVDTNAEEWTTITFKPGDHGKWVDGTTNDVVVDAIKGVDWSAYANQVPAKPVQNEIGWKLADEIQIWDQPLPTVVPDGAVVYTAVWTGDMANVSFQLKGIQVDGTEQFFGAVKPDTQSIQKGKTAVDPTATTTANIQPGYKFVGWYTNEGCTELFNFSNVISGDTPLYGKVVVKEEDWAKVTFKAGTNGTINGGAGDVDTVVTDAILLGNTIGRAIPTAKANAGYEFDAWYKVLESDSETEKVTDEQIQNTKITSNLTYLAKFSELLKVTFVVDLNKAAEGTLTPDPIQGISRGTLGNELESKIPTTINGRVREGENSHDYEFAGWDKELPETLTSNLTLTAMFNDIYTFVVEHADIDQDGAYPESTDYIKKKPSASIGSKANDPIRGYKLAEIQVFIGKDENVPKDENGKRPMDVIGKASLSDKNEMDKLIKDLKDGYGITLTEDGTLSGSMPNDCMWIKYGYKKLAERTVEYVSEGNATGMPDNMTDRYIGDEIVVSTVVPQRNGFDFGGWEVIDQVVTIENGKFVMPDRNVKLKAIWRPNEEVWTYTIEHYLDNATTPFSTTTDSVLKREPNIESIVLNAPQGYKFKEYQLNGDTTGLPVTIGEDGNVISVIYEKNDLIVKHVYDNTTVYDTTQSKANVNDSSVVVNAVKSGRYTKIKAVTVNGVKVDASLSVTLDFAETSKYEVVFEYGKRSTDTGEPTTPGGNTGGGGDFGETVTILEEEVPLADGLNMIDHFAYIFGYEDDTVRPMNRISREEVAAIFYRLLNDAVRESLKTTEHNFPDVSGQRWSNKSIATLTNGEILAGYPNGQFKPGNSITRAEFAVIVSKFDSLSKTETNMFKDIDNHWAKDFINSAALKGWISGYPDGTFHPDDYITRAEAMTLINSVLNRKVSKEGLLENAKYWIDNRADAWYYEAVMEATNSHDYTRETADGVETWTAMKPDKIWD